MPPPAVKTVKDLLFWQYSKIISESAGMGKKNYGFIMDRFKKLRSGEINWSTSIREYIKEREKQDVCIYCGRKYEALTIEHILPKCRGGPDEPTNAVWVCRNCNSSKGDKRLYEWFGLESRNKLPRIAEGKYLKLLYDLHARDNTLDVQAASLCSRCDLSSKCQERGELSVYCLEGTLIKKA